MASDIPPSTPGSYSTSPTFFVANAVPVTLFAIQNKIREVTDKMSGENCNEVLRPRDRWGKFQNLLFRNRDVLNPWLGRVWLGSLGLTGLGLGMYGGGKLIRHNASGEGMLLRSPVTPGVMGGVSLFNDNSNLEI